MNNGPGVASQPMGLNYENGWSTIKEMNNAYAEASESQRIQDIGHRYDVVIIGAGPSGLALAQGCTRYGRSVLVIEKEDSIGGCHRVQRVDGMFTEHGPRMYSTNYQTFDGFLREFGESLNSLFVPANVRFPTGEISTKDYLPIIFGTFALWFDSDYGKNQSMKDFMIEHGFSDNSKEAIDLYCRFTDGASADRYTVFEFLNLMNQSFFYRSLEPRMPNDVGLFNKWQEHLQSKGVHIITSTKVQSIDKDGKVFMGRDQYVRGDNIVFAVPPECISGILERSPPDVRNAFGEVKTLDKWSHQTSYNDYVSFTLHWSKDLNKEISDYLSSEEYKNKVTPWGIGIIHMSKYMNFGDARSKTVLSCAVTRLNTRSPSINKSANECSKEELHREAVQQVLSAIPGLPKPDTSVIWPGCTWNPKGHWDDEATAWVRTPDASFMEQQSAILPWLWNVGCQNGYQKYNFTSLEAAVSNSAALLQKWFPEASNDYPIVRPFTLGNGVFVVCIVILIIITMIVLSGKKGRRVYH